MITLARSAVTSVRKRRRLLVLAGPAVVERLADETLEPSGRIRLGAAARGPGRGRAWGAR